MISNRKITATILALGMVLTGFALLAAPATATVPVFRNINLIAAPIATDNTQVGFSVCGCADIGVDVTLEVSTTANFVIGSGTTFTTTNDNFVSGAFKVTAAGLLTNTAYHWRATITNGTDTIYYPGAATTSATTTCIPGTTVTNGATIGRVYHNTTGTTIMNNRALVILQVTIGGVESFPMGVIAATTGLGSFTGNNLRRQSDTDYMQIAVGARVRYGAFGMRWGSYWFNNTIAGGEPESSVAPAGPGIFVTTGTTFPALYDIRMAVENVVAPWEDTVAPAVTVASTNFGGNTAAEYVTITGSVTDGAGYGDGNAGAAWVQVNGGAWVAATMSATNTSATNTYTYTYNFPNPFAINPAVAVNVRAWDNSSNMGTAATTFAVSDSVNAIAAYAGSTPAAGANLYDGSTATVNVAYEDFTNYSAAGCLLWTSYNGSAFASTPLNMVSFAWGSYIVGLEATFAVSGIGGTIAFYATVEDIGGGALVTLPTRTINVLANAGNVADPYPVYGYVYLYNGNAGVYAPVALANAPVTVTWFNSSSSAWSTMATTSIVTGQYSVDINNYTDGGVIFCNATAPAPYNNLGYNYTTVNIATGGSQQNIVCGVPYDVVITAPLPLANVVVSTPFAVTYRFNDRNGVLCQGYYTFADGPMNMRDMGVAVFLAPADYTFNGIASATPGTRTDNFRYDTPGIQTLNVSEGGVAELNAYLTPWGAWNMYNGAAGYLKDWALVQVNVLGGGFNWHLVDGWNLVSVPADPIGKGTNAVFDAFDALALCFAVSADATLSAAQRNLGTNPSTYVNFDYGMPEAGAFAMGSVYGYWIYTTTAAAYDVNVLALNYSAGSNVVNVVAGWNLLGFTHNMGVTGGTGWGWVAQPTASDFTDGTITAGLNVPGVTKIVATWWNADAQWYNSYVVSTTFPGMVAHDWTYNTNYAYGYWVWSAAAVAVTFNVNY